MKYLVPKRSDLIKVPDKLRMDDFPYLKEEIRLSIIINWNEDCPFIRTLKDLYKAKEFHNRISDDYFLFKDSNKFEGNVFQYLPTNIDSPIMTFDDAWRLSSYFGRKGYSMRRIRELAQEYNIIYTYKTGLGDFEFIPAYYVNKIAYGDLDFDNKIAEYNLDKYFEEY